MTNRVEILTELQGLIDARKEEIANIERRIAVAQETRAALLRDLAALEYTCALYREYHRTPPLGIAVPADIAEELSKAPRPEMLVAYARLKGGRFRVKEAAHDLTAVGAFPDERRAANNISAIIGRSSGRFRWVERGLYELVESRTTLTPDLDALHAAGCRGGPGEKTRPYAQHG